VNVAIEIPDDIGRTLGAQSGDVSRVVLEAVAAEAYRSGAIAPAQVQQMLGLRSRWETESSCGASRRITNTRWMTWSGISRHFAAHSDIDRSRGSVDRFGNQ